MVFC
ncbi:unnamed protein product [Candida parapsilosis]|jgi:hypothetical protein